MLKHQIRIKELCSLLHTRHVSHNPDVLGPPKRSGGYDRDTWIVFKTNTVFFKVYYLDEQKKLYY